MDGKFTAKSSDVILMGKEKRCRILAQQNLKGFNSSVCPLPPLDVWSAAQWDGSEALCLSFPTSNTRTILVPMFWDAGRFKCIESL